MKCPRCQQDAPSDADFCPECGAKLALVCLACGTANAPTHKFCKKCGQGLATDAVAGQPPARSNSPESYTPRHLAEKILTSKSALEGERKQVTVLFADLKGSMELLADRDPEDARKILDPVLTLMMEAVHRYEGTVNQVMGDGVMALFGAPLAHEDHAVRACYAALRMQESVKKYADEVRRSHAAVVKIRVGLNSGEVVVRAIGSDLHMDYTAVGQTTHLAARMEQIADPGAIVITPETLALAEGYVEVRSLGPIPVKGLADPIEIFELTGAGQARTRLQAAALRGLTRFVGRGAEVEHLRRVLGQAGAGHGQVVAIVGEAGVGKSRLTYEFTHSHRVQDWLILEASSVSYGKATSYLPVIDLLEGYFKIGDRDNHREMRDKVMGRVLGLDRALEPLLPPLLALLDVPVEDAAWQNLDPPRRRQRTLDAVKRLLLRESQAQPLLVVFEDLHWIDSETQAVLDGLAESLGSAPLLLLVNYRPEYQHGWGSKTAYSQLRLDALTAASAGELLEALLGDDPGVGPLKQLLVKRGNPFFLEETVRTLVETKALAGERGRYRLTQPIQAIQIPTTVQTILAARIDRLAPEDKRLLQVAAVIGKDVPAALLQAVADLPDEALGRGLDHLKAAEFVYEAGLFPDLEYTFKHALTHEVAYGSLLHERRRALHGRILETIEGMNADYLDEQAERLAHHAIQAERWAQAVRYARQSGARAAARSAYREAASWLDRALAAAGRLPESREATEQAIDIRLDLRQVLNPLAQNRRALEYLQEAEVLAGRLEDRHRLARTLSLLTNALFHLGDQNRSVEVGERAIALAEVLGDDQLRVAASFHFACSCREWGDPARPIARLRRSIAYLDREGSSERLGLASYPAASCRAVLAVCLADLGQFDEATAWGDEAVRIAEQLDHPHTLALVLAWIGDAHTEQGQLEAAAALLERAVRICDSWDLRTLLPLTTARLGWAYALSGRTDEGATLLRRAVEQAEQGGGICEDACRAAWLGEAYLLANRTEDAARLARASLDRATSGGERRSAAWAIRLLGEIAARHESPKFYEAERHYQQAMALADELGMRPLVAHCHLGLGKLYHRTDKHEQAQEHFTTATTMYREMGMTYWLEKAEAEMRELG